MILISRLAEPAFPDQSCVFGWTEKLPFHVTHDNTKLTIVIKIEKQCHGIILYFQE
jgi:hypothetical protein